MFEPAFFLGMFFFALIILGIYVLKHGWGKVLAMYHARAARLEAEAQADVDALTAKARALMAPLESRLVALEAFAAQAKTKLGA